MHSKNSSDVRTMSFAVMAAAMCAIFASSATAQSPLPSPPRTGTGAARIHGMVFDSLIMKPVAGATVMLMSGTRTAVTDGFGQFTFDNVAAGQHPVAFSSPAIDSLGLGTLGTVVTVADTGTTNTLLGTPSLRTLWLSRCGPGNSIGVDSSIVWGTLHDAATDSATADGGATFYWYDLKGGVAAGLRFNQKRRTVSADPAGVYFACGLPPDVSISVEGVAARAASGRVDLTIGQRRLKRLDLLVSEDMVLPEGLSRAATDSALAAHTRGKAVLRGLVHDDKGAAMNNANVQVVSSDSSVRTDAKGQFLLGGLPSGTQVVQVRRVGAPFTTSLVQLRPNQTTDVDILMSATTTLAAVRTVAKSANRLGFDDRRARKLGYVIDSKKLEERADFISAFNAMPLTSLGKDRNGNVTMIGVRRLDGRGGEAALIYLDGLLTTLEAVWLIPTNHFRAIEILPYEQVPARFVGNVGQGVVLFWTKNAKW
jgi:hypothetical protein